MIFPRCRAGSVSQRERRDSRNSRFYISCLTAPASLVGPAIRDHWSIENSLHWAMDMTFRDDECRVRTDHAPANLAVIRHMAHNLIRRAPDKQSLRLRRKAVGWDDGYLLSLLVA
jgi:predicted transposase YbfD/YdcC